MNQLLYAVGSSLVADKAQLSKWLQGIQQAFSELYIASRTLAQTTEELEILKEFLAVKID